MGANEALAGRAGIVTGAASGIGRAAAVRMAEMGANVSLVDLNKEGLMETQEVIQKQFGRETHVIDIDASDESKIKQAVRETVSEFGRIDFLINAAGILRRTSFLNLEAQEWDLLLGINLRGPFLFTKEVAPIMKEQGSGSIVNVASLAGRTCSLLGGAHYTTAKHGLVGLSRHTAMELAQFGIRVNAFCPGATLTPMVTDSTTEEEFKNVVTKIPRRKIATPEEQAKVIGFLVSDDSINIVGACLDSNGGNVML